MEDLWATVAHLCDKIKNLERGIKNLEKENQDLRETNKTSATETTEIYDRIKTILEFLNNFSKIFERLNL